MLAVVVNSAEREESSLVEEEVDLTLAATFVTRLAEAVSPMMLPEIVKYNISDSIANSTLNELSANCEESESLVKFMMPISLLYLLTLAYFSYTLYFKYPDEHNSTL